MSTASSPRSTRHSSPANDGSPAILTPRRKIQALLAGIGSDSESEKDTNPPRKVAPALNTNASRPDQKDGEQSDHAEDDLPQAPKGRLAARMQAQSDENGRSADKSETAFERVKKSLKEMNVEQPTRKASAGMSSSDDDVPVATGKRRPLKRKQNEPTEDQSGSDRARSESPLFCSPYKQQEKRPDAMLRNSDDEDDVQPPKNARFLALVEKKRKEREAREKEEAEKRQRRAEIAKTINSEDVSDGSDEEMAGRKLTQNSKPTRKASKKAIEAMNQETQRISRNMQLAHQAKTKKKITKESFFSRFNFGQKSEDSSAVPQTSSTAGSSQPASGGEEHATPPTSPLRSPDKDTTNTAPTDFAQPDPQPDNEGEELDPGNLMSLDELLANPTAAATQMEQNLQKPQKQTPTTSAAPAQTKQNHGKPQQRASTPAAVPRATGKAPVRIRVSRESIAEKQKNDSDSDLEVVTSPGKCRRIAAFENLPVKRSQDSYLMVKLRALAHLSSPSRRPGSSMTNSELQVSLRRQARLQALREREEKIQELKDKGIYVDTAEERAKVEEEVEDLVEKARLEGEEISKKEKQAAKKAGKDEPNAFDDDDDEDYVGDEDDVEVDLSGSEDENEEDLAEEETGDAKTGENADLVEDQADVAEESDEEPIEDDDIENISKSQNVEETSTGRRKRGRRVISDDEDEEPQTGPEQNPDQQSQPARKPHFPNLQTVEEPSLGLTQAFAATLDSQQDGEQDSLAALRNMPDPGLMGSVVLEPDSQEIVKDSQERPSEPIDLLAGYTQSDSRVAESPGGAQVFTQNSDIPEPTQDAGFVLSPFDQRKRFRDAPMSTQETVPLQNVDSPIAKRRGKLLRRGPAPDAPHATGGDDGFTIKASAFDVLRKKAKKVPEAFDKTKSEAKDIVDEAAEESEDEYAGLGGASDDGGDEEDEYDASMINDNSGEKVDEKQLAALNANHVREQDEKQVSKLLKDITTGALRRKRGAGDDLDLSDSDDERLAARRRAKRRDFNKMRKALLSDEKIGQIAENPKKLAFLRAIEDREPDDDIDMDFLHESGSQEEASKEESVSQEAQAGNDEETTGKNKRKRPLKPSAADTTNRPPPSDRRGIASKKPATLAEIRESVSFLLEGPNVGESKPEKLISDSEEDADDENNETNADGEQNGNKRRKRNYNYGPLRTKEDVEKRLEDNRAAKAKARELNAQYSRNGAPKMAFHANPVEDPDDFTLPTLRAAPGYESLMAKIERLNASDMVDNKENLNLKTVRDTVGGEKKKGAVNYYTAAREEERARELKIGAKKEKTSNIKSLLEKGKRDGLSVLARQGQWE